MPLLTELALPGFLFQVPGESPDCIADEGFGIGAQSNTVQFQDTGAIAKMLAGDAQAVALTLRRRGHENVEAV